MYSFRALRLRLIWPMCLVIFWVSFSSFTWAQLPTEVSVPPESEVLWLIETMMQDEPMVLKPYEFPKEVDRSDAPQLELLDFWFNEGLLLKEEIRFAAVKKLYGKRRKISVAGFRYRLNEERTNVVNDGFYYGRGRVKKILNISEPSFIGHTFFSEVSIEWYVEDMPAWSQHPLMISSYRELRRARESFEKPFERRVYLEYQEDVGWVLWKERPNTLKQPLF